MPQISVTTEGYGQTGPSVYDLPKLEPRAKDEIGRIFIPDPEDVWTEYRHSLGGQRAARAMPPGSPVPAWGGNWICLGRPDVMKASNPSADPEMCGLCARYRDGDPLVDKPTRKYVSQIFRYSTDGVGNLMQPFSVQLLVWIQNDKEFGNIKTIAQQWGDVRRFDIQLKAISKEFKTWEVMPLPQAMWSTQAEWAQQVQAVYAQQHIPVSELALLIGRPGTNAEFEAKLNEIRVSSMPPQQQAMYQGWPAQPQQQGYFPGQQMAPQPMPAQPELAAPPPLGYTPIPPAAPAADPAAAMPFLAAPPAAPAAALAPQMAPPMQPPPMAPQMPQAAPQAPMAAPDPAALLAPSAMMPPPMQPQQQQMPMPQAPAPQQPMPPVAAPPATQPAPAPAGEAAAPVDFTQFLGVPAAPPPTA